MSGALLLFCGLGFLQTNCRSVTCFQYLNMWQWLSLLPIGTGVSFLPMSVSFWFRGTTYQNNSLVTLEDIGEWRDALLCVTDQTACCRPPYSGSALGNWFFPNGTRVPSTGTFDRTRDQSVILLHRRRGGMTGIYSCVVPDAAGVLQTITIGVYLADTGEW